MNGKTAEAGRVGHGAGLCRVGPSGYRRLARVPMRDRQLSRLPSLLGPVRSVAGHMPTAIDVESLVESTELITEFRQCAPLRWRCDQCWQSASSLDTSLS